MKRMLIIATLALSALTMGASRINQVNPLPTIRTYTVLYGVEGKFESTDKSEALAYIAGVLENSPLDAPLVVSVSHIEIIDP